MAAPLQGDGGADVRARRGQLGRQGGRGRPQRPLQERPLQGARPELQVNALQFMLYALRPMILIRIFSTGLG